MAVVYEMKQNNYKKTRRGRRSENKTLAVERCPQIQQLLFCFSCKLSLIVFVEIPRRSASCYQFSLIENRPGYPTWNAGKPTEFESFAFSKTFSVENIRHVDCVPMFSRFAAVHTPSCFRLNCDSIPSIIADFDRKIANIDAFSRSPRTSVVLTLHPATSRNYKICLAAPILLFALTQRTRSC